MVGISRYYCNDLADRPDTPAYVGTATFTDAPSRYGQYHPPNRLFLSDWTMPDCNICCVEVDSDYVDPGFKLDVWRPDNGGYIHVCRIDMPLVRSSDQAPNRKIVTQATDFRPGDLIGWWSSTRSEVKYVDGGARFLYVDDFTTTDLFQKKVDFSFSGSFDRAFSIRLMSDSETWLDMQQAVLDCFPDKADTYLSLARRTYFLDANGNMDPSKTKGLDWKTMEGSCSQKAIFMFPFVNTPGSEQHREPMTYQELIRHYSVFFGPDDKVKNGAPWADNWGRRFQNYFLNYGVGVKQWLEANRGKHMLLMSGTIGDNWNNIRRTSEAI
jgi:hypothetical protein